MTLPFSKPRYAPCGVDAVQDWTVSETMKKNAALKDFRTIKSLIDFHEFKLYASLEQELTIEDSRTLLP
jgi:hypothetical protein